MSEQRFKVDYEVGVLDTLTDEIICDCQGSAEEVVELLNHFHQENNYLSAIRENQQQMIFKLKEENEQLRKELDTFKPVMFQDVRKGTVMLYSKGDSNE